MEEQTIAVPTAPEEGESHEAWLARTLREAFVNGHGLQLECQIQISPEHVKRMVAPQVDDSMFFAVVATADSTRQSLIQTLMKTLVCLHPDKFSGPESGEEQTAAPADQPAGEDGATPHPASNVVPLSTLN